MNLSNIKNRIIYIAFKYKKYILFIIIITALFLIYLRASNYISYNSDDATIQLESQSILNGNIFLKGWTLNRTYYITLDVPYIILLQKLVGFKPYIMNLTGSLIYMLLVVTAIYLAGINKFSQKKNLSMVVTLLIVGFPSLLFLNIVLRSGIHTVTIFYTLLLIVITLNYFNKGNFYNIILFFIFNLLILIGDPLSMFLWVFPFLIYSIIEVAYLKKYRKRNLILILTLVVSYYFSILINTLISAQSGLSLVDRMLSFTSLNEVGNTIYLAISSILTVFNANFFSKCISNCSNSSHEVFINILGFTILGIISFFVYKVIKRNIHQSTEVDRISLILSLSIIFNLLTFIVLNYADRIEDYRYLVITLIFGGIILGRNIEYINFLLQYYRYNLGIYLLILILLIIDIYNLSQYFTFKNILTYYPTPPTTLINWLNKHNLHYGYGTYWDANIITVESEGKEKILEVEMSSDNKRIIINQNQSNFDWYTHNQTKYNFIIYSPSSYIKGTNPELSLNSINTSFGEPPHIYKVGAFYIAVFNHPLGNNLLSLTFFGKQDKQ